ncbi:hypothetical protein GYH30_009567 [Glycine max]|nr:hypothetical protein GYH30_009567 [Glycine max]
MPLRLRLALPTLHPPLPPSRGAPPVVPRRRHALRRLLPLRALPLRRRLHPRGRPPPPQRHQQRQRFHSVRSR